MKHSTQPFILAAVLLMNACYSQSDFSGIQYSNGNGEYTNVLIAIHEDIEESQELIEKLKESIIASSNALSVATKQQAKLGEIKILIPRSWTMEAEAAFLESYTEADVRIRDTVGVPPFVLAITPECGEPGEYMQLSVSFILGTDTNHPNFDKTFVHEWGHLRWGLKDEYSSRQNDAPAFYISSANDQSIQMTRCTLDLSFELYTYHRVGGREISIPGCRSNPVTQMYADNCRGRYLSEGQTATASLMNNQHVASVVDFCDQHDHNREAPTPHNVRCSYKSSWEVMREHSDFAQQVTSLATEPVRFRILKQRQQELRVVIVMDVSGSMTNDRIAELHSSVATLINDVLPTGRTKLGLVQFSTTATKLTSELTTLTDASKAALVALVPSEVSGGTGIGLGLQAALALLTQDGTEAAASSHIIVLSDGLENVDPSIADVIPSLVTTGVIAHSIIFLAGDNALKTLAHQTGGTSLYAHGFSGSVGLTEAFTEIVSSIDFRGGLPVIHKIASRKLVINETGIVCTSVSIDSGLSNDVLFSFQWLGTETVNIRVTQPDGTEWTPITQSYSLSTSASLKLDNIAQMGTWNVCMDSAFPVTIKVAVFASPHQAHINQTDEENPLPPITLETIIDNEEPNFTIINHRVKLFAMVRRGDTDAVIGATVEATISSNSKSETFIMTDSGSGADTIKDDGIYSLYIVKSENIGKHSVQVRVVGSKENIRIKKMKMGYAYQENPTPDEPEKITADFERVALAGFFDVQAISDDTRDMIAPARIHDLRLVNVSAGEKYVTIEWTSVGDDFDQGTALRYKLSVADSVSNLLDGNHETVPQSQVKNGNLSSPNEAYSLHTIQVWMLNRSIATFAVQAVDEQGHASPMSNALTVAVVNLASAAADPADTKPRQTWNENAIIVIAALGGTLVFITILLCAEFSSPAQNTRKIKAII